jgi:hypothetical protein
MSMPMMHVRQMRMLMNQSGMSVLMAVWLPCRVGWAVLMLVMLVMHVHVLMLQGPVFVPM